MNVKQFTFTDMSKKAVINVADGRELGHVCDMVFNNCGAVQGFVVPGKKSFLKSITSADSVFIPWNKIVKIGSDVILVQLVANGASVFAAAKDQKDEYDAYGPEHTAQAYTVESEAYGAQAAQMPPGNATYMAPCSQSSDIIAQKEGGGAQTIYH